MIKRTNISPITIRDLALIMDTLKRFKTSQANTMKIKRLGQEEKRYGLLDSRATCNVREIKKDENYEGLVPVELEVAFDSEVKAELFMNKQGTIIGPEGIETIVGMSEVVKAGYKVE